MRPKASDTPAMPAPRFSKARPHRPGCANTQAERRMERPPLFRRLYSAAFKCRRKSKCQHRAMPHHAGRHIRCGKPDKIIFTVFFWHGSLSFKPFRQIILSSGSNIDWRAFMAFQRNHFLQPESNLFRAILKTAMQAYKVKKSGLQTRPQPAFRHFSIQAALMPVTAAPAPARWALRRTFRGRRGLRRGWGAG